MTIINDILDFSKIEAGRLRLEPVPFDIMVAVEEVGELLSGAAAEKGVDLIIRVAPGVPRHLVGDPGRIRQILINLVGNAIKFTAKGHVLVNVERDEAGGGEALPPICGQRYRDRDCRGPDRATSSTGSPRSMRPRRAAMAGPGSGSPSAASW